MDSFKRVVGPVALMPGANIDTDVIMPKQFLKGIDRTGLAEGLFHDLRFDGAMLRPSFILNQTTMRGCRSLMVGPNFGCGSSREHAVWGLLQYGIRAVIGTSFAGIFADNAANNGLLLIALDAEDWDRLASTVREHGVAMTVDLEAQTITVANLVLPFPIEAERRAALMGGLDRIGTTLRHEERIRSFERDYLMESPWL